MKTILVTGGAGFIGSHFVDLVISETDYKVIVLDKLTYAGKLENMSSFLDLERVQFIKGDICDYELVSSIFKKIMIDYVVNFAAESHVDNSINESAVFIKSNINGTHVLLDCARKSWTNDTEINKGNKFIQISTDEVYGMLGDDGSFSETDSLLPSSPYSASKASADLICLSYFKTYKFPVLITRSSNNYGPRQDREKLIPKTIMNTLNSVPVPIYGKGDNVRDWIYVQDNCRAIFSLLEVGNIGEVYNIGSRNELSNLELVEFIQKEMGLLDSNLIFVEDRLGHDFRYAINDEKINQVLKDYRKMDFSNGIRRTIDYYRERNGK